MASQATLELMVDLKGDAEKGLSSLGGTLKSLGGVALGVAAGGIAAVGATLISAVGDARQAQQVMAQTEAVIKSTGGAAGVSAEQVADYASSLSAAAGKSLFGDDQIQQSENLLLTFTNIKGASLEAATAMSVDLAQAMGGEPKDAAIQLGKALNDPMQGISALTRIGVTFDDQQKKQIKTMQEAGNMAGAQGVILAELNKEFGGSAQAAADADGGWAQFTDRMGEAKEAVGTALLPLLGQLAGFLLDTIAPAVEAAAAVFQDWMTSLDEGGIAGLLNNIIYTFTGVSGAAFPIVDAVQGIIGAFQDAGPLSSEFGEAIGGLAVALGLPAGAADVLEQAIFALQGVFVFVSGLFTQAGDSASGMGATFEAVRSTVEAVMTALGSVVGAVLEQIMIFWRANGADIMAFVSSAWGQIQQIIQVAMQLIQATIVPILVAIAGFIRSHSAEIQTIFGAVWNAIKAIITAAMAIIKGVLTAALQIIKGDWSGAWETIKGMLSTVWESIKTILNSALTIIKTLFSSSWEKIKSDASGAWETIKSTISGVVDSIVTTLEALPGKMVTLGGDIINGIIDGVKNAAGRLYSALSDIANDALQSAKDSLGIGSPSRMFADEVGEPIVLGILEGLQALWPDLLAALQSLGGDLASEAEKLADKVSDAIAGAFDATASIDRQAASNIDAVRKLATDMQGGVQEALAAAQAQAAQIQDPEQAAKYFKMRSSQILELAKLQQDYNAAVAAGDDTRAGDLAQQMNLIKDAQQAEQEAATQRQSTSGSGSLLEQIQALLDSLTDPGSGPLHDMITMLMALLQQVSPTTPAGGWPPYETPPPRLPPPIPEPAPMGSGGPGAFMAGGGITFGAGAIVINGAGQNAQQIAQMVLDEIRRRTGGRF